MVFPRERKIMQNCQELLWGRYYDDHFESKITMKDRNYQIVIKAVFPEEFKREDTIYDSDLLYGIEEKLMDSEYDLDKKTFEAILNELQYISWQGISLKKSPNISVEAYRRNDSEEPILIAKATMENGKRAVSIF